MKIANRRNFLKSSAAAAAALSTCHLATAKSALKTETTKARNMQPIPSETVRQFVQAAHSNLENVQSMLDENPRIANATWDWANGDFETALGGASHMGRPDIAKVLIAAGFRPDAFYYAMSGNLPVLQPLLADNPQLVTQSGPHGISLLYHVAISANLDLADLLKKHGATADTRSLHASVNIAKSYEMTEWLLANGAVYDSKPGFNGKTHAQAARENNLPKIATLLESSR